MGGVWSFGAIAEKAGTKLESIFSDCFCQLIYKMLFQDLKCVRSRVVIEATGEWDLGGYS